MKALSIVVMLALLVGVSFAQDVPVKVIALRGLTSGTLFSGKAYVDSQSDTTQTVNIRAMRDAYVRLTVLDSAGAVTVWYRPLISGTTFMDKVTIGTFAANTLNGGKVEAFALPATALSGKSFQLGVTFAGSGAGVTSPTYTLDILAK